MVKKLSERLLRAIHIEQGYGYSLESLKLETQALLKEVEALERRLAEVEKDAEKWCEIVKHQKFNENITAKELNIELDNRLRVISIAQSRLAEAEGALKEFCGDYGSPHCGIDCDTASAYRCGVNLYKKKVLRGEAEG